MLAFSPAAIARLNGQTIPPVGAHNAATVRSVRFGSLFSTSSLSKISHPGTPLALACSNCSYSNGMSSSWVQTINFPFFSAGKFKSLAHSYINSFPLTQSSAIKEPGGASNPVWITPVFAFEVPEATSSPFSITHAFILYRDISLAIQHPDTPAPIIIKSYI